MGDLDEIKPDNQLREKLDIARRDLLDLGLKNTLLNEPIAKVEATLR